MSIFVVSIDSPILPHAGQFDAHQWRLDALIINGSYVLFDSTKDQDIAKQVQRILTDDKYRTGIHLVLSGVKRSMLSHLFSAHVPETSYSLVFGEDSDGIVPVTATMEIDDIESGGNISNSDG